MQNEYQNVKVDEYLHSIKIGDTSAIDGLYECTYRPLFTLCYSYMHNIPDSEDVLHDAYLTAVKQIQKYSGTNGFNWLFTITKNTCLNVLKKNKHIIATDFDDEIVTNTFGADPNSQMHIFDESGIFSAAETALNENEFRIVILHAVNGIKFGDIAKGMEKLETTVRWQYNNAIKKVQREYERRNKNGGS